jgi:glycerol-3-phosphate dehydrogenase
VLIAPTVFGNVLLGPTAVDGTDKVDLSVTQDGLRLLLCAGGRMLPDLTAEPIVSTYAGLRAVGDLADYRLEVDGVRRIVLISGIRSTGLTSSPAIAEDVVYRMQEAGLALQPNVAYRPDRPASSWRPGHLRPCLDAAKVSAAPRFGRIVCLCESVSEGEIVEALHRPVPARTLDGVKKRTWATAGRCQAYFCTAALLAILSREGQAAVGTVTRRGPESEITAGPIMPWVRRGP